LKEGGGKEEPLALSLKGHWVRLFFLLVYFASPLPLLLRPRTGKEVTESFLTFPPSSFLPSQLAGLIAGQAVCFVAAPTEHLKARLQVCLSPSPFPPSCAHLSSFTDAIRRTEAILWTDRLREEDLCVEGYPGAVAWIGGDADIQELDGRYVRPFSLSSLL
jgi:hypothetical protein